MKGDPQVIEALNAILTSELTAINQYFIHHRMCANWGYQRLSAQKRKESVDEMRHADRVIDRILFLEGVPNMQRLSSVKVGENPLEQHELDLALELDAVARLRDAIALTLARGDHGTRELLEAILKDEEAGIDWLEAQLHIIKQIGLDKYLAEQIHG